MKDSRKREHNMVVGAGLVAIASVALWLYVDGAALLRRQAAGRAATPTATGNASVAKPLRMAGAASTPAPSTSAVVRATATAPITAGADATAPAVTAPAATEPASDSNARVPAESSAMPAAAPDDDVPVAPGEANATATPTTSAPPPASSAQDTATPADPAVSPPAPDVDTASHDAPIDLFAQRLAKLEQNDSADPEDISEARQLTDFKVRGEDEAASSLAQVLNQHVTAWLGGFPAERSQHLSLVSGECRVGACRMLIAESAADLSPVSTVPFEQALRALLDEGWCRSLGLALQYVSMHAVAGPPGGKADHALWTIYLRWTVSG